MYLNQKRKNFFLTNCSLGKFQFRDMPFNGMKAKQFEPHEYHTQIMQDTFPDICDI